MKMWKVFLVLFLCANYVDAAQEQKQCFSAKDDVFQLEVCVPRETVYKDSFLEFKVGEQAPVILEFRMSGEVEIEGKVIKLPSKSMEKHPTSLDPKAGATYTNGVVDERRVRLLMRNFWKEGEFPVGSRVVLNVTIKGARETSTGIEYPTVKLDGVSLRIIKP